jgi:DNA-binding LacI/PurR family transcriptional regulator
MAKLKDVAEKAGVSISTASIVLNGKADSHRIAPATARKILQVAGRLEYLPNVRVRTAKHGVSDVIAFAFPMTESHTQSTEFWMNILLGANEEAIKRNKDMVVIPITSSPEEAIERVIRYYREGRIDSAILPGRFTHAFKAPPSFPIVFLGKPMEHNLAPHVKLSFRHAYYEAITQIIAQKKKKILWLEQYNTLFSSERYNILKGFTLAHGLELSRIELGLTNTETIVKDKGIAQISDACEKHLDVISKNDAIFCYNDTLAIGLCRCAIKNGYKIPNDFSVIGFDNLGSRFTSPRIATIDHKNVEIGAKAVSLIMRITASEPTNMDEWRTTTEYVNADFIQGETL